MSEQVGGIYYEVDARTGNLVRSERQVDQSTKRISGSFNRVNKSTKQLNTEMKRVAKTIAGVFAVRQLQRFIVGTAEAIDQQAKFAQQTGVAFESLQRLQFAAEQTGGSIEGLNNSLRRGARNIQQAADGTGSAVDALAELNIEASRLTRESPDEQFKILADAISGVESASQQASIAYRIFGRDGEFLLNALRQGRDGLETLGNEAQRTGRIISQDAADSAAQFNDELNKLRGAARGAAVQMGTELLPSITGLITATTEWLSSGDNAKNLITGIGIAAQTTAAIVAGRFISSIALSITATAKDTIATNANVAAKKAKAVAANQAAAAELALLRSNQANLVAQLQSAKTEALKAQIRARLAANTKALVAANTALTASQTRLNAAMAAGTAASRGLAAGLALLGGPIGAITIAASAFALIAINTRNANREQVENARTIASLTGNYDDLSDAQLRLLRVDIQQEMRDIERATEAAADAFGVAQGNLAGLNEQELKDLGEFLGVDIDTSTQEREAASIALLRERYKELEETLKQVDDISGRRKRNQETEVDVNEDAVRVLGDLARRNEEYRSELAGTNDELAIRRALQAAGVEEGTAEANVIRELVMGNKELAESIRERNQAEQAAETRAQQLDDLENEIRLLEIKNALGNEEYERQAALAALGDDATPEEIARINELIDRMQELRFQAELLGQSMQSAFKDIGLNALDDFSAGLARVAIEGGSVEDMLRGVARTMVTELLTSVIRYWAGQAAAALAGQAAVTTTTIAAGGAAAAAWTPAATLASIATLGGAAGIGTAAVQGALATSQIGAGLGGVAGARFFGGNVEEGRPYQVGEMGRPEMLVQGGKQFLIPGADGEVKPMQQGTGGGGDTIISPNITVQGVQDANGFVDTLFDNENAVIAIVRNYKNQQGQDF